MKLPLLSSLVFATLALATSDVPGWQFNLKAPSSGIVALESVIVNPNLALWFDRPSNDPLQIDNHSAWGALFNLQTAEVTPINVITNSFCGSGAFLSNGTMVRHDYSPVGCALRLN